MRKKIQSTFLLLAFLTVTCISCQKEVSQAKEQHEEEIATAIGASNNPTFNLEVTLRGEGDSFGLIKFRQDVDPSKIIVLDTWVRNLEPNHQYLVRPCNCDRWFILFVTTFTGGFFSAGSINC